MPKGAALRSTSPNHLRELRLERGLTQEGLAAVAGVSTSLLNRIENYDHIPYGDRRQAIATALKVQIAEIWPQIPVELQ